MNAREIIVLSTLLLIVLTAGCSSPFGGSGSSTSPITLSGAAVTFTQFAPVVPQVRAGSPINLYLQVQNNGYFNAEEVTVTIYNCGSINTGDRVGTPGADVLNCNSPFHFGGSEGLMNSRLAKPDTEVGVPGELVEEEIAFPTSGITLPQGRSQHTMSGRVSYNYKTTASRDVVLTTFQNYRDRGGQLEVGSLSSFSSPAPVILNINAPKEPIILSADGAGTAPQTVTIALNIKNTGNGFAEDRSLETVTLCYNNDVFTVSDFRDFDALTQVEQGNVNCTNVATDKLSLVGVSKQSRDVDIQFETLNLTNLVQDIATFDSTITYRYSVDTSTTVTLVN